MKTKKNLMLMMEFNGSINEDEIVRIERDMRGSYHP